MRVLPAIDLQGGRCVRLKQGRFDDATVYAEDPAAQARAFLDAGARWLHVVDLDGASAGAPRNARALKAIAATGARMEVGGGLRDLATIASALALGAERVVLGTVAVTDPELLAQACRRYPGRVLVAVDAKGGEVAVDGWARQSGQSVLEVARRARDAGAVGLLYTDIARDGMGAGVNVEATAELAAASGLPVIASGGVRDLADLDALAGHPGIEGAIAGRSVYEGTLDVAEACRRHGASPLFPDGPLGGAQPGEESP